MLFSIEQLNTLLLYIFKYLIFFLLDALVVLLNSFAGELQFPCTVTEMLKKKFKFSIKQWEVYLVAFCASCTKFGSAVITFLLLMSVHIPVVRNLNSKNSKSNRRIDASNSSGLEWSASTTASETESPINLVNEPNLTTLPSRTQSNLLDNTESTKNFLPTSTVAGSNDTTNRKTEIETKGARQQYEVEKWLYDEARADPNGEVEVDEAWQSFEFYQQVMGYEELVSEQNFKRIMTSKFKFPKTRKQRNVNGKDIRFWCYRGLKLISS